MADTNPRKRSPGDPIDEDRTRKRSKGLSPVSFKAIDVDGVHTPVTYITKTKGDRVLRGLKVTEGVMVLRRDRADVQNKYFVPGTSLTSFTPGPVREDLVQEDLEKRLVTAARRGALLDVAHIIEVFSLKRTWTLNADVLMEALVAAVEGGREDVVKILIDPRRNEDDEPSIFTWFDLEMVGIAFPEEAIVTDEKFLLSYASNIMALESEDITKTIIYVLINDSSNIDITYKRLLMGAAEKGAVVSFQVLKDKAWWANVRDMDFVDVFGAAVMGKSLDILLTLIDEKPDLKDRFGEKFEEIGGLSGISQTILNKALAK